MATQDLDLHIRRAGAKWLAPMLIVLAVIIGALLMMIMYPHLVQ